MKKNIFLIAGILILAGCGGVHQHFGGKQDSEKSSDDRSEDHSIPIESPSIQARIDEKAENQMRMENGQQVPESYFDFFDFSFDLGKKGERYDFDRAQSVELKPKDWVEEQGRVVIRPVIAPNLEEDLYLTWKERSVDEREAISAATYELFSFNEENEKTASWESRPAIFYPENGAWIIPLAEALEKARPFVEKGDSLGISLVLLLENEGRVELEIEFNVTLPLVPIKITREKKRSPEGEIAKIDFQTSRNDGVEILREVVRNFSHLRLNLNFQVQGMLKSLTGVASDYYETQPSAKSVNRRFRRWVSWGDFEVKSVEIRTRPLENSREYSEPQMVELDHRPIGIDPETEMEIRWIARVSANARRCELPEPRKQKLTWKYISDRDSEALRGLVSRLGKGIPKTDAEVAEKFGKRIFQDVTYHHWISYFGLKGRWTPLLEVNASGDLKHPVESFENLGEQIVSVGSGDQPTPADPHFSCQGVF